MSTVQAKLQGLWSTGGSGREQSRAVPNHHCPVLRAGMWWDLKQWSPFETQNAQEVIYQRGQERETSFTTKDDHEFTTDFCFFVILLINAWIQMLPPTSTL